MAASGATTNNEKGTYTLSVRDATDDFAAGTGTTGTVEVGGTATGEIETLEDRDWFAVTLKADKIYRIDLEGAQSEAEVRAGALADPYLRGIHDAAGTLISGTADNDGGVRRNSRVTFTPDQDGPYYVAAGTGTAGFWPNEGTYTLSVTDITDGVPDDYAADTSTTGTVAVGSSVTGDIETSRDRDWFAVTLEAGQTYRIDLEGSRTAAGTLGMTPICAGSTMRKAT